MHIVAGVDGGGTRTRVLLADSTGNIHGFGVSGSSNYGSVSVEKVEKHLSEAFEEAFDKTNLKSNTVDALFMGMAGVVSDADRNTITRLVKNLNVVNPLSICVDHDIRISLAGGLAGKEGISLIAGTGSSCYGRLNNGEEWMSGGWGHLIDDKGSAYDLAVQSLSAVVRAGDGRGEPTILTGLLMERLQIDDISHLMRRLYYEGFTGPGNPMNKEELASLASSVFEAAEANDHIARKIIENGVDELVLMVGSVAKSLSFSSGHIPVVMTGGTVQHSKYMKKMLVQSIESSIAGARIYEPEFPPAVGAVLLALKMINHSPGNEIFENLKKTLPLNFN